MKPAIFRKWPYAGLLFFLFTFNALAAGSPADRWAASFSHPLQSGGWVCDFAGVLGAQRETIEAVLEALEKDTSAEVAVVTFSNLDGLSPKAAATALFNHWKLGKKGKDNGVLILHTLAERRVEMDTGYGSESILPDAVCSRLLRDLTVPKFKTNDFSGGHLALVRAVDLKFRNPDLGYLELMKKLFEAKDFSGTSPEGRRLRAVDVLPTLYAYSRNAEHIRLVAFWFFGLGVFCAVALLLGYRHKRATLLPFHILKLGTWLYSLGGLLLIWGVVLLIGSFSQISGVYYFGGPFASVIFLISAVFYYGFAEQYVRGRLRNDPRICRACKKNMERLPENQEDAKLTPGQIAEEKMKAVDYDVWSCSCGEVRIETYRSFRSGVRACPKCANLTYQEKAGKILAVATLTSTGQSQWIGTCAFCGHAQTQIIILPKIQPYSSDGDSDSSSSSSSSSDSSGSSSGGGSSGGGGAGSSY